LVAPISLVAFFFFQQLHTWNGIRRGTESGESVTLRVDE
jgi:hypothetical protein